MAPAPVCAVLQSPQAQGPVLVTWPDAEQTVGDAFARCLASATPVVGHYVAFDMGVLWHHCPRLREAIVTLYDRGLVLDTALCARLVNIAAGREAGSYSLAACAKRSLGIDMEGKDGSGWRLRFGELAGLAVEQWPTEAVDYAIEDVRVTAALWHRLRGKEMPPTLAEQCRAEWALHAMSAWGLRTDPDAVSRLSAVVSRSMAAHEPLLVQSGIAKRKSGGGLTKSMGAIRERVRASYHRQGLVPGTTPTGKIKTERDDLLLCADDPALQTLVAWGRLDKIRSTYLPPLLRGTTEPLHVRYTTILRTGRTSASGPNIQNQPRSVPGAPAGVGVRESFVPRPGWVYVSADYSMLELRCLASVLCQMFGSAKMADALRRGLDLHLMGAAALLSKSYSEVVRAYAAGDGAVVQARQLAKAVGFGVPGGLGAPTLAAYLRGYGLNKSVDQCRQLIAIHKRTWPRVADLFAWRSKRLHSAATDTITHPQTGFVRGGCTYCAGLNFLFQHPAAHGAKRAGYRLWRESYWDHSSPLYGVARPVAFVHDEYLLEVRQGHVHEVAARLEQVMSEEMATVVGDIPCPAEAVAMQRWSKDAKPVRDAHGRLVPWQRQC